MNTLPDGYAPRPPADNLKQGGELLRQQVTLLYALYSIGKKRNDQFDKNELIRNNHKLKHSLQYLSALLEQLA